MAGDEEFKLGELVRLHHRSLVRFVSRIVGNTDTAEDIAQDVYLKFSHRGDDAAAVDYPKTYLFTAARNAAFDHTQRVRAEWQRRQQHDDLHELPSDEPAHDIQLDARRRLQHMADALNELPPACREAFVLNKLRGLDHRSIALQLGVSVSMVEKHIMRAVAHCRDRLRETDVED